MRVSKKGFTPSRVLQKGAISATFRQIFLMYKTLSVLLFLAGSTLAAFAQSATELYNQGKKLLDDKKYSEAYAAFKSAVVKDPSHKEALYEAGWCANELEKFGDAVSLLQKAKAVDASNQKIWFELGYAYRHLDKPEEALSSFKKCLQLSPDYEEAALNIAEVYYDAEDYENALTYYVEYLKEEDADNYYFYRAGWCANDLERYEDAIVLLDRYLPEEAEEKAKKYGEIGYSYYKLENAEEAVKAYKTALLAKPDDGVALRGLGDTYDNLLGQNEDALDFYQRAVQKDPDNSQRCYSKMGWLYNDREEYENAVPVLLKAVEYDSESDVSRVELGFAYYKLGKYEDALKQLKKAVQLNSSSSYGYYYQGLVYLELHQKAKAKEMYEKLKLLNEDLAGELMDKYKNSK